LTVAWALDILRFVPLATISPWREKELKMSTHTVIAVTVEYVGQKDFVTSVPPAETLQAIKVQAMKSFGLEPGAADRYVLTYNGQEQADREHVGDLGASTVVLKLTLLSDLTKG
jgi:hypothetical protein